jgi:PAS domain S-box-containing protein
VLHDGRVTRLTLVARDVTEREQVLDALRESEQRYHGLVAGSRDAIFITTLNGEVVDFNQAALDLFGYTREELPLANVTRLYVDAADRARFRAEIERHGSVRDYEVKLQRKDGTPLIGLLTATVRTAKDGTIVGYQGIVRDITQRRMLEREVLESTEREQRRIGQDLHDGLGQHLTGVAFLTKVLTQKLSAMAIPEAAEAVKIEGLIDQAIRQTRNLAKGLQPVVLEARGLATALEEMCLNLTELFSVECRCCIAGELSVDDNSVATNVYYIAREAVNNAVKHSGAKMIAIELRVRAGVGILTVEDGGRGCIPCRTNQGLGLQIMRYRAEMIGGSLEIRDRKEGGTMVRCTFPIKGSRKNGSRP